MMCSQIKTLVYVRPTLRRTRAHAQTHANVSPMRSAILSGTRVSSTTTGRRNRRQALWPVVFIHLLTSSLLLPNLSGQQGAKGERLRGRHRTMNAQEALTRCQASPALHSRALRQTSVEPPPLQNHTPLSLFHRKLCLIWSP